MGHEGTDGHENNFGILRLMLAVMVIVAHTPELADGDRSHELLTRLFGTISFGELAVDGFFLVSGFLVTKSFVERPGVGSYMRSRIRRILPAYLVNFWLCVLVVSPLAGGDWSDPHALLATNLVRSVLLLPPQVAHAFDGSYQASLNGAAWTIAYEFRCYLLVALLGVLARHLLGLGVRRSLLIAGLAALVVLSLVLAAIGDVEGPGPLPILIGTPHGDCRLFGLFGTGALFFFARSGLRLTNAGAAIALVALLATLVERNAAELGVALFGGYLTFWFALRCAPIKCELASRHLDISYGLYLYAWPIEKSLFRCFGTSHIWLVGAATVFLSALAGYLSWHLVEKIALGRSAHGGRARPVRSNRASRQEQAATTLPHGSYQPFFARVEKEMLHCSIHDPI